MSIASRARRPLKELPPASPPSVPPAGVLSVLHALAADGWRGAVLLERPSSAPLNALSPLEMREQLE